MPLRLLLTLVAALTAVLAAAAPAHAGLSTWTSLTGLTTAAGADHVREYATGSTPLEVFAATEDDGVFRSGNAGVSWSAFNAGLEGIPGAKNVRTVFKDGSRMLAGTSAGLFASTGGAWQPLAQGPEEDPKKPKLLNTAVQALYKVSGGPLLAGGFSSGVFRSNDGGNTWIHPAPGNGMPAATTVWHLTSFVPGVVFAATSSGIYRSTDAGASWTFTSDGIAGQTLRVFKDSQNPLIYYAGTTDGVYRTVNAGLTWSAINGSGSSVLQANTVRGMLIRSVANRTRVYAATENGLWVGTAKNDNVLNPGPVTWRHVTESGLGGHDIFWTISDFNPALGSFIAGTDGNGGYAITLVPPVNTVAPSVSGTQQVGKVLTTTDGSWTGTAEIDFTYQWQRCATASGSCTDIDGAEQKSYTLTEDDKFKWIRAKVTAQNDVETFVSITEESAIVGDIDPNPNSLPGGTIRNNPTMPSTAISSGGTVTVNPNTWIPAPTTWSYRWFRCTTTNLSSCEQVATSVSATYPLTDADVEHRLRAQVVGTNANGTAMSDLSSVSNIVAPKQATNLVAPSLSGSAVVGESLLANVGKWEYPGTTYERQWYRCEADGGSCQTLSGQKGAAYQLTAADLGKRLKAEIKADSNAANVLPGPKFLFTPLSGVVVNPPADPAPAPGDPAPAPPAPPAPPQQVIADPVFQDTSAPVLGSAKAVKTKVKRGGKLALAIRPSEAGRVRIEIQSLTKGRRQGTTCKAGRRTGKRCTITRTVLTKTVAANGGAATISVTLKRRGKALKAGSYRARITPIDAAGNRGRAKTVAFRITR